MKTLLLIATVDMLLILNSPLGAQEANRPASAPAAASASAPSASTSSAPTIMPLKALADELAKVPADSSGYTERRRLAPLAAPSVLAGASQCRELAVESIARMMSVIDSSSADGALATLRLADAAQARAADAKEVLPNSTHWRTIAVACRGPVSPEQKAAVAKGLVQAFQSDQAALGRLSATDVRDMVDALRALGDSRADVVAAAVVSGTTAWRDWPISDKTFLASVLSPGDRKDTHEAIALMSEVIHAQIFADAKELQKLPPDIALSLSAALSNHVPTERLEAWAASWKASAIKRAPSMKPAEVISAFLAGRALGDASCLDILAAWAAANGTIESTSASELATVACLLQVSPASHPELAKKIASQVDKSWFGDASAAAAVSPADLERTCQALSPHLADQQRSDWLGKIKARLDAQGSQAGSSSRGALQSLARAAKALGDTESDQAVAQWVNRHGLSGLSGAELADIATAIRGQSAAAKAARATMLQHLQKTLRDRIAFAAVGVRNWQTMLTTLSPDMPDETRREWAQTFLVCYEPGSKELESLAMAELPALMGSLQILDCEDPYRVGLAHLSTPSALSGAGGNDLAAVVAIVQKSPDKEALKSVRPRLIDRVSHCFADAFAVRKVRPESWRTLAEFLAEALSEPLRQKWAQGLQSAFFDDEIASRSLGKYELTSIAQALESLGRPLADSGASATVLRNKRWRAWPAADIVWLCVCSAKDTSDQGSKAQAALMEFVAAGPLGTDIEKLSLSDVRTLAGCFAGKLPPQSVAKAQARARAVFDQPELQTFENVCAAAAMLQDLDKTDAQAKLHAFISAGKGWPQWKPAQINWLVIYVKTDASGRDARMALARTLDARLLDSPEHARETGQSFWYTAAYRLAPDLTSESRATWAQKLREAFGPPAEVFAKMSPQEMMDLRSALVVLGDKRASGLVLEWMKSSESWRKITGYEVIVLTAEVRGSDAESKEVRLKLLEPLEKRGLDEKVLAGLNFGYLKTCADSLSPDLGDADKARLITKLRGLFTPSLLETKSNDDLGCFVSALKALGDRDTSGLLSERVLAADGVEKLAVPKLQWVLASIDSGSSELEKKARSRLLESVQKRLEDSGAWKDVKPKELIQLAKALPAEDPQMAGFRGQLKRLIAQTHLKDSTTMRSAGLDAVCEYFATFGKEMSQDERARWLEKFSAAWVSDKGAMSGLTSGDLWRLLDSLAVLGGNNCAALVSFVKECQQWKSWTIAERTALAWRLGRDSSDAGKAALSQVAAQVAADLNDAKTVAAMDVQLCQEALSAMGATFTPQTADRLRARLRGCFEEPGLTPYNIRSSTLALLAAKDPAGLAAVKDYVGRGDASWRKWTPQDIQMFLAALTGADLADSRLKVCQFLFEEYARPDKTADVNVNFWWAIVQQTARDFSGQTRQQWAARLKEILLAKGWESLTPADFTATLVLLRELGDGVSCEQAMHQLVQDGSWQPWALKDLLGLVNNLWPEKGPNALKLQQQLVEFFGRKYLYADAPAKELGWAGVRTLILGCRPALTEDVSTAWAQRLLSCYGGAEAIASMPAGEIKGMIDTLSQLGHEGSRGVQDILVSKINKSDDWRGWPLPDVLWLAGTLKIDTSESGQSARKRLGDCILKQYLCDAKSAKTLAPAELATAIACLDQEEPAARSAAARQIAAAYAGSEAALAALSGSDFRCVYQAVRDLDAEAADPLVGPYMSKARGLMETPLRDLLPLFKCLAQADPAKVSGWLADIEKAQLASGEPAWQAAEGFTAVWDALGNKESARAWAKRLSASLLSQEALAPDQAQARIGLLAKWDKPGALEVARKWNAAWEAQNANLLFKWDVTNCVISIFTSLGEQETASKWALRYLASTGRKDAEALTPRLEEDLCATLGQLSLAAKLWDVSLPTVFKRVAHADAQDRSAVWQVSLAQLPSQRLTDLNDSVATELSALILALDPDGPLTPGKVVSDLMEAAQCGPAQRMSLERQLQDALLLESAAKTSPAARQLVTDALAKVAAGEADAAMSLLDKCLQENVGRKDLANALRRAMLPLLLEKDDAAAISAAHDSIRLLLATGADNELRNFVCRLAMLKVSQASAPAQKKAWDESISLLPKGPIVLLPRTLEAFEKMVASLPRESSLSADQAAVDLMLLTPDLESLAALSAMRSALSGADERVSRLLMSVLLQSATDAGCSQALHKCVEVLPASQDADQLKAMLYWGTPPPARPRAVDAALAEAARKALAAERDPQPRRKALLLAMSGQEIAALQVAHAALQAADGPRSVGEALDDIAAVLAIHDGDYHRAQRFAHVAVSADQKIAPADEALKTLMQCEGKISAAAPVTAAGAPKQLTRTQRVDLIRQALAHRRASLLKQVAKAMSGGDKTWAAAAWCLAVNQQPTEGEQSQVLKQTLEAVRQQAEPADVVEVLQAMRSHLPKALQRQVVIESALVQYAEGNHEQCLALLDEAAGLASPGEQQDVESGHMRAMSLVRLRKHEDALKQLEQIKQWKCSPEDQAKTAYLIGWVQLQQNAVSDATATFDALVQKHPSSPFAAKARQLLEQLRSN